MSKTTYFGFQKVTPKEKTKHIFNVFCSVAPKYDLMNDLMSLGIHRLWKRQMIQQCNLQPQQTVCDLASGTCDLGQLIIKQLPQGQLWLTDINENMLRIGRDKLTDKMMVYGVHYAIANAENLPFENNFADCISMAFGLRNVTNISLVLKEMYRILKPGGRAVILEFSKTNNPYVSKVYDWYSFHILPKLGEYIANDRTSYQYLVESIRKHPDQKTLKSFILNANFSKCDYINLNAGIVAIHRGFKY